MLMSLGNFSVTTPIAVFCVWLTRRTRLGERRSEKVKRERTNAMESS